MTLTPAAAPPSTPSPDAASPSSTSPAAAPSSIPWPHTACPSTPAPAAAPPSSPVHAGALPSPVSTAPVSLPTLWQTVIYGLLVLALLALIVGLPFWHFAEVSTQYRNFRVVEEGKMYRSGRLGPRALDRVCREYQIGTVINLRDRKTESGKNDDQDEEDYCRAHGIRFIRIEPGNWSRTDSTGEISGERNLRAFFDYLRQPETRFPVLVHCFAGIHRTGPMIAAYRMEYQNWSPTEAVQEMCSMGTVRTNFDSDLRNFMLNYTPRGERR